MTDKDISWREWYREQWQTRWSSSLLLALEFHNREEFLGQSIVYGLAGLESSLSLNSEISSSIWLWMKESGELKRRPLIPLEAIHTRPENVYYNYSPSFKERTINRTNAIYRSRPSRHHHTPFDANAVVSEYSSSYIYKSKDESPTALITEPLIYCRIPQGIHSALTELFLKTVFSDHEFFYYEDYA